MNRHTTIDKDGVVPRDIAHFALDIYLAIKNDDSLFARSLKPLKIIHDPDLAETQFQASLPLSHFRDVTTTVVYQWYGWAGEFPNLPVRDRLGKQTLGFVYLKDGRAQKEIVPQDLLGAIRKALEIACLNRLDELQGALPKFHGSVADFVNGGDPFIEFIPKEGVQLRLTISSVDQPVGDGASQPAEIPSAE